MSQELEIWLHNNPFDKIIEAKPHSDAILQQLLQNTLNTSQPIKIFKNSNGKPYIKETPYFSHSNSRNLYAYVISNQAEVAIDVEKIDLHRDVMKLAKRYFHPDEWQQLKLLPAKKQPHRFYQLWTKKEAWCKLEGGNLWSYLKRSVLPDNPTRTEQGALIHLINITHIDGFACSIASTTEYNQFWINSIA